MRLVNYFPDDSAPVPFEAEFPAEGKFMMDVFAAGGTFKRRRGSDCGQGVPPPRDIPRNFVCPCGSGKKTKKCHLSWTSNIPGLAE